MNHSKKVCKNCGSHLEGKYCNNCGQKSNTRRIDFRFILNEISDSIFQVEHGLFYTILEMIKRPGHSIREFLQGRRKKHIKPLSFVFLLSTIYILSSVLTRKHTLLGDIATGMAEGLTLQTSDSPIILDMLDWMVNNQAYAYMLILPLFSLASFLAFYKFKYNYLEHLVINCFISGQQMLIYFIFSMAYFNLSSINSFLEILPVAIGLVYTSWAFHQLFNKQQLIVNLALVLLTYFYFFILIVTSIFLIGMVGNVSI